MRGLLLASAVIALVAVAAPSLFMSHFGQSGRAGARPPVESLARTHTPERRHSRQFEVQAARDGHFYVDAEINFRSIHFLVDTGATIVALRESDAASAGIRPHATEFEHPVQTANGTTKGAYTQLDRVMIDDIEVRNVRALVLPDDQLSISLLGGSFLNGIERFEVRDGRLVLED